MNDITVIVPHKPGREDWLQDALASIPMGLPYIVAENDGELAEALNEAIRAAETEYVLRLDDDDLLDEGSVWKLRDAVWDVDVAYPSLILVNEKLQKIGKHEPGEFCGNRLQVWNYIPGAGAVMRRDSVLDVGGYREMDALEDWDLWVRMHRAGKTFKNHPEAVYFYRQSDDSRNKIGYERAQELKQQIAPDEPDLLATWYSQETVATTYWRCVLPARHLPGQVILHRPTVNTNEDDFEFPHHRGAAIWQFPGHHYERFCMAAMQEKNIPVLVETDDNYLTSIPYGKDWMRKTPGRGHENTVPSLDIHRKILGWVDGVIVTTEHLAKQYRKHTKAPVMVCPNQIDPADWVGPEVKPDWYDPDKLYVGFAGSASHLGDMKLIGRALHWASEQPHVEVLVMGSAASALKGFQFRHVPWTTDLGAYRALLHLVDIGLAPVVENPWSVARSDLKILEYAMAGAVTVCSDAIPYKDWSDCVRKAGDPKEFLRATQELVRNPDEAKQLAADCKTHVLSTRTHAQNSWRWREAIETEVAIAA